MPLHRDPCLRAQPVSAAAFPVLPPAADVLRPSMSPPIASLGPPILFSCRDLAVALVHPCNYDDTAAQLSRAPHASRPCRGPGSQLPARTRSRLAPDSHPCHGRYPTTSPPSYPCLSPELNRSTRPCRPPSSCLTPSCRVGGPERRRPARAMDTRGPGTLEACAWARSPPDLAAHAVRPGATGLCTLRSLRD
jgi:hypothetical protein